MRRLALATIVTLLAISASGMAGLFMPEPCTGLELAGSDGTCPPTCVICGCCAQAAEAVLLGATSSPDAPVAGIAAMLPGLLNTNPRDILHVPRLIDLA